MKQLTLSSIIGREMSMKASFTVEIWKGNTHVSQCQNIYVHVFRFTAVKSEQDLQHFFVSSQTLYLMLSTLKNIIQHFPC